jgi:hypothetical protein
LVIVPASVVDPDPFPRIGSGSWRAKMARKNRKQLINFMFSSAGKSLMRAKGFSCSLDFFYGGLVISKLQFLIKKDI